MAHHHAVIYAVGASRSRDLAIPGQDRPGSHAAADFVAWYNGHPDHARDTFDLSGQRAVIIGNGNVALDVARMLLLPHEELARTDIADHALTALADSKIREVVILARRSPRDAAFSVGEFHALGQLPGIDVIIDSDDLDSNPTEAVETALKLDIARGFAQRQPSPDNKRIVFRFMVSPAEIVGDGDVEGLRLVHNSFGPSGSLVSGDPDRDAELIETSLILRSIGHTGMAIEGVPFEAATGTVPNQGGRVLDGQGQPIIGLYVTGWIKRGPRGVIGTNRTCAQETVASLWADFDKGRLARDVNDHSALDQLLGQCGAKPIDWQGWCAINSAECKKGKDASRPRVKFVDVATMVAIANSER
jgi:ferredoxin--NADP+ reductase